MCTDWNRKTNELFVFFTSNIDDTLYNQCLLLAYEEQCQCSPKFHYGSASFFTAFRILRSVNVWLTKPNHFLESVANALTVENRKT